MGETGEMFDTGKCSQLRLLTHPSTSSVELLLRMVWKASSVFRSKFAQIVQPGIAQIGDTWVKQVRCLILGTSCSQQVFDSSRYQLS